jgi:hypothetical protein
MPTLAHFILTLYFAGTVGIAGAAKLSDPTYFKAILKKQGIIPRQMIPCFALLLPSLEILLSFLLVSGFAPPITAALNVIQFIAFLSYKALFYRKSLQDKQARGCGCYSPKGVSLTTDTLSDITVSVIFVILAIILLYLSFLDIPLYNSALHVVGIGTWVIATVYFFWNSKARRLRLPNEACCHPSAE